MRTDFQRLPGRCLPDGTIMTTMPGRAQTAGRIWMDARDVTAALYFGWQTIRTHRHENRVTVLVQRGGGWPVWVEAHG